MKDQSFTEPADLELPHPKFRIPGPPGNLPRLQYTEKNQTILSIRNLAASFAYYNGGWEDEHRDGYLFSFSNISDTSDVEFEIDLKAACLSYAALIRENRALLSRHMLFGLQVRHGSNVFEIEWDDTGVVNIINFTRGDWEAALLPLLWDAEQ